MSGICWVSVKREGSYGNHPLRVIGGERKGLFGGYGRLGEEFDDFGASRVVLGSGPGGHCRETSQRGLAVAWEVRTGSDGRRGDFVRG